MFVITADQVDRQRAHDRVPAALSLLTGPRAGAHLGFERTAGDEIQGVCEDPADVVDILTSLIRHGDWRIGLGIGRAAAPNLPTRRTGARIRRQSGCSGRCPPRARSARGPLSSW